jgi:uncharacterized protein YdhG (YjbR/CyaY superfamily)
MSTSGDRTKFWPLIEKRYGQPMTYWFSVMKDLEGRKYPEQIAYLKEEHGFNQAHANALVMFSRGSVSTQRYTTLKDYLAKEADVEQAITIKDIFKAAKSAYPKGEVVIAWNKPLFKLGETYLFGVSTTKNYLLVGPHTAGEGAIKELKPHLEGYKVNKKTFEVPSDWDVDTKLIKQVCKVIKASAEKGK